MQKCEIHWPAIAANAVSPHQGSRDEEILCADEDGRPVWVQHPGGQITAPFASPAHKNSQFDVYFEESLGGIDPCLGCDLGLLHECAHWQAVDEAPRDAR